MCSQANAAPDMCVREHMKKKSEHEVCVMPWIAFIQADKHTIKAILWMDMPTKVLASSADIQ